MILCRTENGIARITLNRPDKRNALSPELIGALKGALVEAAANADVRVVLLDAAGPDFCSGADLAGLRRTFEDGPMEHVADARLLADLFVQMRRHPRPIVAAVRGRALAGGCGLACAADLVVAAESARFGYPEVNIGFVPAIVTAMLRRAVPEKRAFELIALGETISAQAALDLGLINRVFPDAAFAAESDAFAAELAGKSASAVALAKRLLYHIDSLPFDAAIESGVQVNALARLTPDYRRGIERFLKKGP